MRFCLAITLLVAASSSHANTLEQRAHTDIQAAKTRRAAWKATEEKLGRVARNQLLGKGIAASGELVVLAEREGEHAVWSPPYWSKLNWLGDGIIMHAEVKVKWREQLVRTEKGLEVHGFERYAEPTSESLNAARAILDERVANKQLLAPETIKFEHGDYGPEVLVEKRKVKTRRLAFGTRLDRAEWQGHVTPESIDARLDAHANR
jgi:hypothetical protein